MARRKWGSIGPNLPTRRKSVPKRARETVRERAGERCEDCGRPLAKEIETHHPPVLSDGVLVTLLPYRCWQCNTPMKAVHVELAYKGKPLNYIEEVRDPELGEAIRDRYPWFKPSFSKTVGYTYYGNRCPKCDSLQGHYFVTETAIGIAMEGGKVEEVLLPWKMTELQLSEVESKTRRWGHLHHVDGDPANNDPSNIRLLCVRCHRKRHTKEAGFSPTGSPE